MANFSTKAAPRRNPIQSVGDTVTYEGGWGVTRDPRSELFLLAVSNMVGEDTFYEGKNDRQGRFQHLLRHVSLEDPAWMRGFIPFLRGEANMRTASVVAAAEYVASGAANGRQVVDSALQRADEPAEILAYWRQTYGRSVPSRLKRGVADAVQRLYTPRAAFKYDGQSRAWRMGDVVEVVHPKPVSDEQSDLFRYLIERTHGRDEIAYPESIASAMIWQDIGPQASYDEKLGWLTNPDSQLPEIVSWENVAGWLGGPLTDAVWERMVPQMGYMALIRNLRHLDNVSEDTARYIRTKLMNPIEVQKSRQFPYRFYSAYKNGGLRFQHELEVALQLSLHNITALGGRTLVLIDVSGSMDAYLTNRSVIRRSEVAALFGAALNTSAQDADVVVFGNNAARIHNPKDMPILKQMDNLRNPGVGHGTNIWGAVAASFENHNRIVILTDEQGRDNPQVAERIGKTPVYVWNLAGYRAGVKPLHENHHTFGGFSDAAFKMIPLLESKDWPWVGRSTT